MPASHPPASVAEPDSDRPGAGRGCDVLLESFFVESEEPPAADRAAEPLADSDQALPSRGLFDVLAPLVTDVVGSIDRPRASEPANPTRATHPRIDAQRDAGRHKRDQRRLALLSAITELAETHAIAADLASSQATIDLPLDVPDPVFEVDAPVPASGKGRPRKPLLIVPDVIRTCRDRLAAYAGASDRTRLDVVAALFDHVLADDRLPAEIRNTLARLQLPVLRMALADDSFFASRTHPTRRLLDRLAASAAEWKLDSDAGRAFRNELERVVRAVIHGSSEDAGEHARLLEEFENRQIEIATAATTARESATRPAVVPDAQDRDVLVIKATIVISQLLEGFDVERAIRYFLLDVWCRVLAAIVYDSPAGCDATLARAKRLCVDLAWSVAPKTTSGERARLAGLLPTMVEALREGFRMIEYPKAEEARFFVEWVRLLHQAVRRQNADGALQRPDRFADSAPLPTRDIDEFARQLREGSFGPEIARAPGSAGAAVASTAPSSAPSPSSPPSLRSPEEVTPSMLGMTRAEAKSADAASTSEPAAATRAGPVGPPVIADLNKGDWFELREPRGFVKVRLSWISPLKSFYLFIGADSALTRSFDPAALGALIGRGDLRRVVD